MLADDKVETIGEATDDSSGAEGVLGGDDELETTDELESVR